MAGSKFIAVAVLVAASAILLLPLGSMADAAIVQGRRRDRDGKGQKPVVRGRIEVDPTRGSREIRDRSIKAHKIRTSKIRHLLPRTCEDTALMPGIGYATTVRYLRRSSSGNWRRIRHSSSFRPSGNKNSVTACRISTTSRLRSASAF